jgi:hypothetical protein
LFKVITISMTTFIDFVVASPGSKVAEVRDAQRLYGRRYSPAQDPYKEFREAILKMHREGRTAAALQAILLEAPARMAAHWAANADGYQRFMGRKKLVLRPIPKAVRWTSGDLAVSVNPEVALNINGKAHLIKWYFKAEPISKVRINSMLQLLAEAFSDRGAPTILDVRRGKAFTPPIPATVGPLLRGEAASFVQIWRELQGPGTQPLVAVP